jgi:Biotin-protein ligase, N terminal
MRRSSRGKVQSLKLSEPPVPSPRPPSAAFLWDESFLWGLMSYKALCAGGLAFDLVRSEDIRNKKLKDYSMLYVPGGWASNKIKSLGEEGVSEIRRFIEEGGNYLGFCGGAGLATLDGIGLLHIRRKPTKERVPSFSGRIQVKTSEHEIWKEVPADPESLVPGTGFPSPVFHAWWPSQFVIDGAGIDVLASYGKALPDSFSSDLNVGDASSNGNWAGMEKIYGINLDPARLMGDPAVVEGRCGKGTVVLSLLHFDTPDDRDGQAVLRNLWTYLGGEIRRNAGDSQAKGVGGPADEEVVQAVSGLARKVEELISLGARNFLWFWRNPMLLQWRRGVRGLEYCTLYVMVKEIARMVQAGASANDRATGLDSIRILLDRFVDDAMRLLLMERIAMQNGHITYEKCNDPEIGEIRTRLFSNSKSHGGLFKELLDVIDGVLFSLLMS